MSGCDFDALESLVAGELSPTLAREALAHAETCPACARELTLLRAERSAFAERARDTTPLPGFSAALAQSRWGAPAVSAAKPPPPASKPRFAWAISAFGVAAAAAFAGLFLVPPGTTPRIEQPKEQAISAEPASEDFCHDEAFYNGITSPPKGPNACEMPAHAEARAAATADVAECGSCASGTADEIDTCGHDSCVTEACSSPLPD